MIIKDWWYAIKVCRKYGITWNPLYTLKNALFIFKYHYHYHKHSSVIRVNPFYKGFIDAFMHEVGHCLRHRRMYMKATNYKMYEGSVSDIMKEEYIAWKFSKRALGAKFNRQAAVGKFKTYFPRQAKAVGSLVAADQFYEMSRSIEK